MKLKRSSKTSNEPVKAVGGDLSGKKTKKLVFIIIGLLIICAGVGVYAFYLNEKRHEDNGSSAEALAQKQENRESANEQLASDIKQQAQDVNIDDLPAQQPENVEDVESISSSELNADLALTYFSEGDCATALNYFKKADESGGNLGSIFYESYGDCLAEAGQQQPAENAYNKAIQAYAKSGLEQEDVANYVLDINRKIDTL